MNDDYLKFSSDDDLESSFSFDGSFGDILASLNVKLPSEDDTVDLLSQFSGPGLLDETDSFKSADASAAPAAAVPAAAQSEAKPAPAPETAAVKEALDPGSPSIEAASNIPSQTQSAPAPSMGKKRRSSKQPDSAPFSSSTADSVKKVPVEPKRDRSEKQEKKGSAAAEKRAVSVDSEKTAPETGKRKPEPEKPGKRSKGSRQANRTELIEEDDWAPYEARLKKKKRRFCWGMAIYILLFVVLAAVGVYYLHGYIDAYERSRPEHYMDRLMQSMSDEDWYAVMLENFQIPVNEFEERAAVEKAYEGAIVDPESDIVYRKKVGEYSDAEPVYTIRSGGNDIMLLHLLPDETRPAGYGFYYWKPGEIEALANGTGLKSVSLEIEAPENVTLLLNGKPIAASYVIDDQVSYPLSDLEKRFSSNPHKLRYRVDGLYLDFVLQTEDGTVLEPVEASEQVFYFQLDQKERWSFSVSAMSDMTVMVNGAELKPEEAAYSEAYPVLKASRVGSFVSEIPTICTWRYRDLYSQPEIRAFGPDGEELTPEITAEGMYVFRYQPSQELEEQFKDRALGFLNAYIKYGVDDKNNTDSNYYRLVNYVLKDSELRNFFYSSYIGGIHWASVKSYTIDDIGVKDFIRHGDNCFSCVAYFKMTQDTYYETQVVETAYVLVFVKSGNAWWVVDMDDSIG